MSLPCVALTNGWSPCASPSRASECRTYGAPTARRGGLNHPPLIPQPFRAGLTFGPGPLGLDELLGRTFYGSPGPPVMSVSGFDPSGIFSSQGADSTIHNATDDDRISGNLTRFIGNHTVKFGGEFLRATFNYVQENVSAGLYTFNNGFTAQNPLTGVDGLGLASFLLGYPTSANSAIVTPRSEEQLYPALFVNDDWRATSKLTLHIGTRWELLRPFTERHDRISYFEPNLANPILAAAGLGNYPGSICLVSSSTRSSRPA